MKKRLLPLVFILVISAITVATYLGAPVAFGENVLHNLGHPTMMVENLETYFKENLSIAPQLLELNLTLRRMAGPTEQNGILITDDGLIYRFSPTTDTAVHRKNTRDIISFAETVTPPTAVVILPTASAIYQDKLPPFAAQTQMNQRSFIEETGRIFLGSAMAVDPYPTLYGARKEYLYARTDKSLTTRGGFLVYEALARRLGFSPKKSQDFRLQFLQTPYYGDLYDLWGYGGVKGDTMTVYHSTGENELFSVHHWLRYEEKVYHSLYPDEALSGGDPRSIILGGRAPIINISNYSVGKGAGKLLVFGDSNVMSFLPFLAFHYSSITFADTTLLTDSELAGIDPDGYSQVLFTFSIENYMNTAEPSRATASANLPD